MSEARLGGRGAAGGDVFVRLARAGDLSYIDAQRRRESESIGFLPAACYEAYVTGRGEYARPNHRIWIAAVNGDQVGFLYASPGRFAGPARIIQICIQRDARRIEYGRALVEQAEDYATSIGRTAVGAHVAADIEAGAFWDAMQYPIHDFMRGGVRRNRTLESRYKLLPCGLFAPDMLREVTNPCS